MAEMSRRFNFDDFDAQIAEALAEHELSRKALDERMAREAEAWEEERHWGEHDIIPSDIPGQIGAVIITPLYREWFGDDLPPDAA